MTTPEPNRCDNCGHTPHDPGTECPTRVDHGRNFHLCLCLNRPGASVACPTLMRCQGGPLDYADIWHLQRARTVLGPGRVITPDVLASNPAAAVEVRDRCPHCGDHQLVPRVQMAEHLARLHPDERAVSGVQPDTRPVPDTERRERWASALAKAAGSKAFAKTGTEWDHARGAWGLHADAALAVADEEQGEVRRKLAAAESIRENADFHLGQQMARRQVAEKENARLRAELGKARTTASELTQTERDMLGFALGLAQARIEFTAEDRVALDKLRDLAAAAPGGQAKDGAQQK